MTEEKEKENSKSVIIIKYLLKTLDILNSILLPLGMAMMTTALILYIIVLTPALSPNSLYFLIALSIITLSVDGLIIGHYWKQYKKNKEGKKANDN